MNSLTTQVKAHRFRTQLATIVSSVELLVHYAAGFSAAERESLVREIGAAAERMREMLDEAALAQQAAMNRCQAANEAVHG